ncbi:MAG TPA: PHB depolymerase family esterase [Methylocella sp.]|nr:PHB depolymerase family esterase [Methylocella sp.]
MNAASLRSAADGHAAAQVKKPLGEVLELLRQAELPRVAPDPAPFKKTRKAPPVPKGAAYLARSFACAAGSRDYKVYVPSRGTRRERPLILMLHGCSQNSDDFALGTGMNRLAEEFNLFVAYPDQSLGANPSACWNWFKRSDQLRDLGEPSVIAGITRTLMTEFEIDPNQVYVAGLSAGGAMAAIMSTTYPELYAAAAIHSGLAYGSASDMASAFAAMRGAAPPAAQGKRHRKSAKSGVRTIVFHGASDRTVYPSNAERILTDARAGLTGLVRETQHEGWAGGRAYRRTVIADAHGVPHVEYWSVEGLGHAWSGGNPEGSYTDRRGPDASREMLRFFFEGPGRMPAR